MELGITCASCGAACQIGERFCPSCGSLVGAGQSLPPPSESMVRSGIVIKRKGLEWRWVLLGTLITLGLGSLIVVAFVVGAGLSLDGSDEPLVGLLAAAGGGVLASFFVGGLVVGRVSSGRTVIEPAISGALAIAIIAAVTGLTDSGSIGGALCSAPVLCALSLAGGWLGERWQSRSRR